MLVARVFLNDHVLEMSAPEITFCALFVSVSIAESLSEATIGFNGEKVWNRFVIFSAVCLSSAVRLVLSDNVSSSVPRSALLSDGLAIDSFGAIFTVGIIIRAGLGAIRDDLLAVVADADKLRFPMKGRLVVGAV